MSFLHPEYFYYLIPLLFIIFSFLLLKKEAQEHFFSKEVMEKLQVTVKALSLKTRNKLFFLIGLLLAVTLAEPVIKDGTIEIKSKSADIMIALDISDSMLAEDIYPNRLRFVKQKAMKLLKLAPRERIGVVAFAKNSYLVSPMSFDHDAVGFLLRQLGTDSITEKGTDFMALLNVVHTTIKKEGKKHLLILSDGGDKDDFSDEIEFAKENNIVVYILGVGTQKGAPIKNKDGSFIKYKGEIIVSSLNEDISKFATESGGVYIESVKSDDDVKAMLHEIDRASTKKELQVEEVQKFIALFYYPLGLAIFLLLIATSSIGRKNAHPIALIMLFVLVNPDAKAGLFDFIDLENAKEAYESQKYKKSQDIYSKYAGETNSSASYYNKGNSLYKQEKFDEAIAAYSQTKFDDNSSKAATLANIGNAHVKQGEEKSLENAVKAYEESLANKEDKEVQENLEAVKKELEKQKQDKKQEKQEKQDKQDNKDKKSNKDSDEDKKSDKKSDEKGDEQKDKKDKKSDGKSEEEKKKEQEKKEQEESKKKKENLDKLDEEKENDDASNQAQEAENKDEMSDAEEEKWLNRLNSQQNTFMYMLNDNDKSNEENLDEKPW